MHFKENRGRGFAHYWSVVCRNYLMLRPMNVHPCFLEQICDIIPICLLYFAAEQSNSHCIFTHTCIPGAAAPQVAGAHGTVLFAALLQTAVYTQLISAFILYFFSIHLDSSSWKSGPCSNHSFVFHTHCLTGFCCYYSLL